jgi:DNA-binding NtrC family response regulator
MAATILIADDDPIQRRLLSEMVRRFGYETVIVENGQEAIGRLQDSAAAKIDVAILDLVMPELDGMGVLGAMRAKGIQVPVIVQTAHGSIDTVISAMRAGALDFVVKPVGGERLQVSIKNALRVEALEGEIRRISRRSSGHLTLKDLLTRSNEMARVIRLGERAVKSNIPVLLEGESGVGKEIIARAIQGGSDRRGKPFITVNCGAIAPNLVESILFGHEKGAFTGATERHIGKFMEAHGGTLFLDEIGELPAEMQVKLLRAVQEGEIDPVGSRRPQKVDVRLISATNQNLIELVKRGRFREDLYYRLNVFPITVPALRNRREDIPDLARMFMARFAAEEGKAIRGMSPEAAALLSRYDWPGNVRQLENAMFRAVVLCDTAELTVAEFPQIASHVDGFDVRIPPVSVSRPQPSDDMQRDVMRVEIRDPHVVRMIDDSGEMKPLDAIEGETIRFAIDYYRGQMSRVARKLAIGRSTLYRKLKEMGIDPDMDDDAEMPRQDTSRAA